MKVSLSWLKEYVPIETEVSALADALTMLGLEVEVVSDRYEHLDKVVVARIVNVSPHPNADKLTLCEVDAGDRRLRVVCGAPNVKADALAPLALVGTVFPDGSVLGKGVIRGQTSEGMLCSAAELELGDDESGIMILDPSLHVGDKIAPALGLSDTVFEIGLTPNRPDCLSVIGIAREIAAFQNTPLHYPKSDISDAGDDISKLMSVRIEAPDHCPRYAGRLLENITIAPSPFWLQDRLISVGLRPINNIVDITNFVMLETGQPLHAFDFDQLADHRIVVRTAHQGEPFATLDGKERELSLNMLMICDGERPVGIGGVMGGLNSEIEETTTRVFLEGAYFDPVSIRKTSKGLGLSTDASYRFERGVDPKGTITAINRATRLMAELGGGQIIDGLIDEHPEPVSRKHIPLSVADANQLLGIRLKPNEIENLLKSIEFQVEHTDEDGQFVVCPPSFRVDVTRPVDLMEEVARLSGYQNIPTTYPLIPSQARPRLRQRVLREQIRGLMTGFGFTEAINYSFVSKSSCDQLQLGSDDPRRRMLDIINPLTEDQAVMRTSLISGLLNVIRHNIAQQVRDIRLFETGKVFISNGQDKQPEETEMLTGIWTGARADASWHSKETDCDFFDIKGVAEGLLSALDVRHIKFTRMPDDACCYSKPGHTAQISVGDEVLGLVGEVHPRVLRNFDLKQTAFVFELNLGRLNPLVPETKQFAPIPKYPAVSRDTTLIVDKHVEAGSLLESARNAGEELMEDLYFLGVYEGKPIPDGHKSVSFRIVYRSPDETLEDEKVTHIHKHIADKLIREFDAALP